MGLGRDEATWWTPAATVVRLQIAWLERQGVRTEPATTSTLIEALERVEAAHGGSPNTMG